MNSVMSNPLSTPAQLRMLVDGMTGDPGPMERELGVQPRPFTVEKIRPIAEACLRRLPIDLRLDQKWDGSPKYTSAMAFILAFVGFGALTTTFRWPGPDLWTRLVSTVGLLGAVGAAVVWKERGKLFRVDALGFGLGLAAGLLMYGTARLLMRIGPVGEQVALMLRWTAGHSPVFLLATVVLAAIGEEVFWRGAVTRALADPLSRGAAWMAGALLFGLAHAASGMWFLPAAAFGAGLVWGLLFITTRSLWPPILSHVLFDALFLVIAPPLPG